MPNHMTDQGDYTNLQNVLRMPRAQIDFRVVPSNDTRALLPSDGYIPVQQPRDHISQLPDEILEVIIRNIGPRFGTASTGRASPSDKRDWLSCAAVCRQWHRITIPHSFRYIRVTESRCTNYYNERTASNFYLFLQQNPSIAPLIQEVNFLRVTVNMDVLSSITDALVNLKYLILSSSLVEGNLDPKSPTMDRKLDRLLHRNSGICGTVDCSPVDCGGQLPKILSLFSEIGELEASSECRKHEPSSDLEWAAPRIRSFNTMLSSEPCHTLQRLGIFNALTCLQLQLNWLGTSRLGSYGIDFPRLVGNLPTLRELYLQFTQSIDEALLPSPRHQLAHSVANSVRDGLAACTSLHAFRFELKALILIGTTTQIFRTSFHLGFLIGLEIIALLHPNQMEHIDFRYVGACASGCCPEDICDLDWTRLQDVCSRFVNLRSFALDMFDDHEIEQKEMFRACAQDRMAHFKDVMLYSEPGAFFRCDDPTCAWYSGSRLNKYRGAYN